MARYFRRFATTYDQYLTRYPLPTKSVTSGIVISCSDAVVQLSTSEKPYDIRRTLLIGVGYGACCFAPVIHFVTTTWARILPSTSFGALCIKTGVDMTTAFPLNLSVMLSMNSLARYDTDVLQSVKDNFIPSYSAGWAVWPIVGVTMYAWIPLPYRVLYVNSVSFLWNGFLCFRFKSKEAKEANGSDGGESVKPMERVTALRPLPDSLSPIQTGALIARTNDKMQVLYKDWSNNRNPE